MYCSTVSGRIKTYFCQLVQSLHLIKCETSSGMKDYNLRWQAVWTVGKCPDQYLSKPIRIIFGVKSNNSNVPSQMLHLQKDQFRHGSNGLAKREGA